MLASYYYRGGLMLQKDQIWITGYGVKAPSIANRHDFRRVLETGACVKEKISLDMGSYGSTLVTGIVDESTFTMDVRLRKYFNKGSIMAIEAAVEAVEMAGLTDLKERRVAVVIGTCSSGAIDVETTSQLVQNKEFKQISRMIAGVTNVHSVSSAVAGHFQLVCPVFTLSDGCTSGSDAILLGKMLLDQNMADICIVGGSETPLCDTILVSLLKQRKIAMDTEIHEVGVPFSKQSDNFVPVEGAGVLVLERASSASSRKAASYGVLSHAAVNNDGLSVNKADMTGTNMMNLLQDVLGGEAPTYVNSQALGVQSNDGIEQTISGKAFLHQVPFTSIKGHIGHPFGASGVIQCISAMISIENQFIPPVLGTDRQGYEDMNIVTDLLRCQVDSVLVTGHGYGGNNACILISKAPVGQASEPVHSERELAGVR